MCGICGIISDKKSSKEILQAMNNAIYHRGPDESGMYGDSLCSLGMRRLSVIDLSSGQQPIYNEDKSIITFLNGEIYNYLELKERLLANGHTFYTKSDTEILPHLYEEYGEDMTIHLKGMYTFCIYDLKEKSWFFARDRFGEKPFFYYHDQGQFSYSSEIGSLLKDSVIPRKLNYDVLSDYLANGFVPEPNTLIENVFSLPPGQQLSFKEGKLSIRKYFSINYKTDNNLSTTQDCVDLLKPILNKAVKRQMVSDVPIGAFLSGGIDSSTVVAHMQTLSEKPIKTFTVKFDDSEYDESKIAREVAEKLGTKHHEIFIENKSFTKDIFWNIIDKVGLPFSDTSAIPSYYITKEIRKYVTVALSGDGGDELFGGYPFYQWFEKLEKAQQIPSFIRKLALSGIDLASSIKNNSRLRQYSRALQAVSGDKKSIGRNIGILFTKKELESLYPKYTHNRTSNFDEFPVESKDWTSFQRGLYYRITHDLPLDMLVKVDRMSMANSLEVRAPFLDVDLFEAAATIPRKYLVDEKGNGKSIIRSIMQDTLPASVFNHPKTGFSIPMHSYMNEEFVELIDEVVLENKKMLELFNSTELKSVVNQGLNQKVDGKMTVYRATHQLWSLMQLGGWLKYFDINVN